jgi:Sulfotransferase family
MIAQLNSRYIRTRPGRLFPRLISYFLFEGRPLTTSGRWFNPITFASLKRAALADVDPATEQPVFITGTGRSGTTVLGMVLSLHPKIGFLNEPKALWHHVHPKDDLIGSYSEEQGNYLLNAGDATSAQSRKVKGMYSSFLHLSGTNVVLDKYPEMIFRTEYLQALFSRPRYIFLHRNPMDTIASTAEWSREHGHTGEDWWGADKRKWHLLTEQVVPLDRSLAPFAEQIRKLESQEDMAAVEWIATMNRGLETMKENPDRFIKIGYEELVSNPANQLEAICKFIGIPSDVKMLEYGSRMLQPRKRSEKPLLSDFLMAPLRETALQMGYSI